MSALRQIFAIIGFPLLFGGALLYGYSLALEGRLASRMGLIVLGTYATVAILERIFPFKREWLHSRGDLLVDSLFMGAINLVNGLVRPFVRAGGYWIGALLAGTIGFELWPTTWPLWAQWMLAMVVDEFGHYWAHRLGHETEFFWRFHAVHHSSARLYWLNASRFHPIDILWLSTVAVVPLLILGAGADVLLLVGLFNAVHGVLQHGNLHLRLGPLLWIFSMSELHRWHHSQVMEEANTNYGSNLIIWDVVFGTRFHPDREPPAEIGVSEPANFPTTFWAQLIAPFRWRRLMEADRT